MEKPYPHKIVIDTNVPKTANLHHDPDNIPDELIDCVLMCVESIAFITENYTYGGIVLDDKMLILDEYRANLSASGKPGIGDRFFKWLINHIGYFPQEDKVTITPNGASFDELNALDPKDVGMIDISDRKFIATAHAHNLNPVILEATDCKWFGWVKPLAKYGIHIKLLCPDYVKSKYAKKILHAE